MQSILRRSPLSLTPTFVKSSSRFFPASVPSFSRRSFCCSSMSEGESECVFTSPTKRAKLNSSLIKDASMIVPPLLNRINSSDGFEDLELAARNLFKALDGNNDGNMSREEFVTGLMSLKEIDITEIECERLFTVIDEANSGVVTSDNFVSEMHRYRWLKSVVSLYHKSKNCMFETKKDYDFTKSTNENYAFPAPSPENTGDSSQQLFFGEFADIRATRDYHWHCNYTPERQLWQDRVVKSCLGKTEPQARPWIVYSCGPMGVGKGHVLSWLSTQGLFPLEFVVHIDPDFFKRIMPEWDTYIAEGEEMAGTLCHLESAYMQEIAQEVALRHRQNVWVDGSLSSGDWFAGVFQDIRKRYPHYRIAIMHITASEATIRERIARRSAATGRNIPESQIVRSLQCPEQSIKILACLSDLVIRISNESTIVLKSVEDYSGNWRGGLERHFGFMSYQPPVFPASLGPLYLEQTSLLGHPFIATCDDLASPQLGSKTTVVDSLSLQTFSLCLSEACVASPYLRQFLNFAVKCRGGAACYVTMTPKFPMDYHHDLKDQAGVPDGTCSYRFVFPTTQYHKEYDRFALQHTYPEEHNGSGHYGGRVGRGAADLGSGDWMDPDILFFRNGGFLYYDRENAVVGALALTAQPSRFFFLYHNPEFLDPRDAERLQVMNRWKPTTKPDLKAKGAKYFTYIYPKEKLVTRQFSDHGSFAYLFREPHEPPNEQDRYFNPMLRY